MLGFCALNSDPEAVRETTKFLDSLRSADADLVRHAIEEALVQERLQPRRSTRTSIEKNINDNNNNNNVSDENNDNNDENNNNDNNDNNNNNNNNNKNENLPPLLGVGKAGSATVYRVIHGQRIALDDTLPACVEPGQFASMSASVAMRQQALIKEVTALTGQARLFVLLDDALVEAVEELPQAVRVPQHTAESLLLAPLPPLPTFGGVYSVVARYQLATLRVYPLPALASAQLRNGVLVAIQLANGAIEQSFLVSLGSRSARADFLDAVARARAQLKPRTDSIDVRLLSRCALSAQLPVLHTYRHPENGQLTVLLTDELGLQMHILLQEMLDFISDVSISFLKKKI